MFDVTKKSLMWGDKELVLETGKIARQADGAIMVTYGETKLLCTVVASKADPSENDFFPLTVHYIEKFYSIGKVPGGHLKREGRPSEKETLTSRLIDRPIRPLFPDSFKNEVQVICQVLNHDGNSSTEIPAIIGASAALTISGIPFYGPLGASKVARIKNEFVLNPTNEQQLESDLDLVVAGTKDGVLMVESEAKELEEEVMLEAVVFGQNSYKEVLKLIVELAEESAKDPWDLPEEDTSKADNLIKEKYMDQITSVYTIKNKKDRQDKLKEINSSLEELSEEVSIDVKKLGNSLNKLQKNIVRKKILSSKTRIDGRKIDEVRQINCETGLLPRAHGSALFTRGETQSIAVLTLGTSEDEQMVDSLEGLYKSKFMLHYNFPPFSVGEAGRMGGTGRREIGHGKLAWRAVNPILPDYDKFPYTIR
ncbi:MAG: Polyribonucleotide nucleotidyltransferase, partial [Alphaproteobacteria bacterium MarineAlpha9_Bin4]